MALGLLCASATFAVWTSGGGLETTSVHLLHRRRRRLPQPLPTQPHAASSPPHSASPPPNSPDPKDSSSPPAASHGLAIQRLVKDKSIDARLVKDTAYLVAPFRPYRRRTLSSSASPTTANGCLTPTTPNTSDPGTSPASATSLAAAFETGLYLLLPLAYIALRVRWQRHRDGIYALPLLCVIAHMAYLLPIGGDHFDYRPLDFYWPLLALPAAGAIALLGAWAAAGLRRLPRRPAWTNGRGILAVAFFLPILFYASTVQGAQLFEGFSIRGRPQSLHVTLDQKNAGWVLAAPGMPALVAISNDLRRRSAQQNVGLPYPEHRGFQIEQEQRYKPYEQMERGLIPDDALASDGGLGKYYYIPDLKIIDNDGLTDATIARTPVTHSNLDRSMGHDRGPTHAYLKQRNVNFEIYPASTSQGQALQHANFAVKFGPDLWMPFDTLNAQWAAERFANRELQAKGTFSTVEPARNYLRVERSTYVGERFLGHFDSGLDGWQISGQAISNNNQYENYPGQPSIWNRADDGFLTSYHPSKGNRAVGRALSPTFTATADHYLAFLIAGGEGQRVGLRLLADGEEAAVWRGSISDRRPNSTLFRLTVHPLGHVAGKTLQLELFDRELGEWGHIMLDHVMLVTCDLCPQEPTALAQALNAQPTS